MKLDCNVRRLQEVAEIIPSGIDKKSNPGEIPVRICNYLDVYNNDNIHSGISFSWGSATEAEIRRCQLRRHDVVITKDSETPDDIGKPSVVMEDFRDVVCGYHLAILRPNPHVIYGPFLAYLLQSPIVRRRLSQLANGAIRFGLTARAIGSICFVLPPLPRQEQISQVLSTWDKAVRLTSALLASKQRMRQALLRNLLSHNGGSQLGRGTRRKVTSVQEVFAKVSKPVDVAPETKYREIGIRSHGKGIFHKDPIFGQQLGTKRVFWVEPGCLTLNIVFAWEQAVAVTSEAERGMIASHRFPMFRPDRTRVLPEYVLLYLLTSPGKRALSLGSPGGAGRNRTLSQTKFLKTAIPLPSIEEQEWIVTVARASDREIAQIKQLLAFLREQRSGLLQKMLAGHAWK